MRLPESFLENMKQLLGQDYDAWLASCDEKPFQGLRINQTKLNNAEWEMMGLYTARRVPWTKNGYYCEDDSRPAKDAYYFAGLYSHPVVFRNYFRTKKKGFKIIPRNILAIPQPIWRITNRISPKNYRENQWRSLQIKCLPFVPNWKVLKNSNDLISPAHIGSFCQWSHGNLC